MAVRRRVVPATAVLLLLGGCAELAARRTAFEAEIAASCEARGFVKDTDAFRICLLLERTDARLAILENRIDQLEFEIRRLDRLEGICRRCP